MTFSDSIHLCVQKAKMIPFQKKKSQSPVPSLSPQWILWMQDLKIAGWMLFHQSLSAWHVQSICRIEAPFSSVYWYSFPFYCCAICVLFELHKSIAFIFYIVLMLLKHYCPLSGYMSSARSLDDYSWSWIKRSHSCSCSNRSLKQCTCMKMINV